MPDDIAKDQISKARNQLAELKVTVSDYGDLEGNIEAIYDHAAYFMQNLENLWNWGDLRLKRRIQSFFFNNGLKYENKDFGTSNLPILVQIKNTSKGGNYSLVVFAGRSSEKF